MFNLLDQSDHQPLGIFELVKQSKRPITIALVSGVCMTVLYLALAPRSFKSDAKLFVRIGRESIALDPTATTGTFVAQADTHGSEVFAIEELLENRVLAEKIVDEFGVDTILERAAGHVGLGQRLSALDKLNLNPLRVYSVRDKAIDAFHRNLRISSGTKTSVITLSYVCGDPLLAQKILESLLQIANGEHLRIHRTRGSQEFFVNQSNLLKNNLARLEGELRDLKNESGISLLPTQRQLQLELIGSLNADLIRARTEQDAIQAEIASRREQLEQVPGLSVAEQTTGQPQSTDQSLHQKVYDLEIREQELAAQYAVEHPLRVELRHQIDGVRRIYKEAKVPIQVKMGVNKSHEAAELAAQQRESELMAVTARARSLDEKIGALKQDIQRLNDSEIAINRLEREIDLSRANWRTYAANLEEARITQQLEEAKISSLNVMQPPTFSETPVSPKPMSTLAFGFVATVMASLGVALLACRRQSRRPATPTALSNGSAASASRATIIVQRSECAPAKP